MTVVGSTPRLRRRPISRADDFNMVVEPTPKGIRKFQKVSRPALNIEQMFDNVGDDYGKGPVKAIFEHRNNNFYIVNNHVYELNSATVIGILRPDRTARFALSQTEAVIVSGGYAFLIDGASLRQIDIPDGVDIIDVVQLGGRFLYFVAGSGKFFYSAVGDAATIDGLSFATAESSNDNNVGALVVGPQVAMFQEASTEFWYPTNDIDAPFQRSSGQTYAKGAAAIDTIRLVDNSAMWVTNDRHVCRSGASPIIVSNNQVSDELQQLTDAQLAEADACTFTFNGHTIYLLTIPVVDSPSSARFGSWAYDVQTKDWTRWGSNDRDRFRIRCADPTGKILGDQFWGFTYQLDADLYFDNYTRVIADTSTRYEWDPITRIASKYFPLNDGVINIFNVVLHCEMGTGVAGIAGDPGVSPTIEMRISQDGTGQDWSPWMGAAMGEVGEYQLVALWDSLGTFSSPGFMVQFRCSDPAYFDAYEASVNLKRPF